MTKLKLEKIESLSMGLFRRCLHLLFCFVFICRVKLLTAQEICQSTTCQQLADDLLHHSMNSSASPCDDFYEYICGNYNHLQLANESSSLDELFNETSISPPNIFITGTLYTRQELLHEELQQAFRAVQNSSITSKTIRAVAEFYKKCTDTEWRESLGTEPLVEYIEQLVGGWPMLRRNSSFSSSESSIKNWQDIFVNVYSKAGLNYIFDIHNEMTAVKVRAGYTLIDKLVNQKTRQRYDAYDIAFHRQLKKFIYELTQEVQGLEREVDLKFLQDIEQLAHFEFKLVDAYRNSSSDLLSQLFRASLTRKDLKAEWISMLNRIQSNFYPTSRQSRRFQMTSTLIMSLPKTAYLEKAVAILKSTPLEVVQNFFATALALEFGALTTERFRTTVNSFTSQKKVFTSLSSEECISLLSQWPAAVDRLYVERHFTATEKAAATLMVEEVRTVFRANLQANRWLDEKTRVNAVKKLDAIHLVVGYEDWILDDEQLDEFYREKLEGIDVVFSPGEFFNGEYFKMCSHYMHLKLKLEHVDVMKIFFEMNSKYKWKKMTYDTSSATVNAYYNKIENSIIIPAGFLKPPFFDQRAPTALNYGSISTIIGHELTHCIDSMGRENPRPRFTILGTSGGYEDDQMNKNWWTEEAADRFHAKAQCMVEQYDNVVNEAIDMHLDGERTLMENLADNSGLKMAWNAFQGHQLRSGRSRRLPGPLSNFTAEQLFFVSHAKTWCEATSKEVSLITWIIDNHSPNKYRVNVPLSNFEPFAETFQCPAGSPMNPLHKCSIW